MKAKRSVLDADVVEYTAQVAWYAFQLRALRAAPIHWNEVSERIQGAYRYMVKEILGVVLKAFDVSDCHIGEQLDSYTVVAEDGSNVLLNGKPSGNQANMPGAWVILQVKMAVPLELAERAKRDSFFDLDNGNVRVVVCDDVSPLSGTSAS